MKDTNTWTVVYSHPAGQGITMVLKDNDEGDLEWDYILDPELSATQKSKCTCGGTKCGTPHSDWCDLLTDNGDNQQPKWCISGTWEE